MMVIIDGVQFVPAKEVAADASALDKRMYVRDFNEEMSLREYLEKLVQTLWNEGEGFSGKRPFGNSGWEFDVYAFLVNAGSITGSIDEDGYLNEFDKESANAMMPGLISAAFIAVQA